MSAQMAIATFDSLEKFLDSSKVDVNIEPFIRYRWLVAATVSHSHVVQQLLTARIYAQHVSVPGDVHLALSMGKLACFLDNEDMSSHQSKPRKTSNAVKSKRKKLV